MTILNFSEMRALQNLLLVFAISLGVTACTPPEPAYPPLVNDNRDRDRERDRSGSRDREDLNRSRDRRSRSNERTGECAKNRQCQDICDDIFRSRKDREDCEDHSIAAVERMEEVFEVLEDPDTDELAELSIADLELLLKISAAPLEKAVDKMSTSEQKKFLIWMAEDSEAAEVIANAEEDFSVLEELFGTTKANIITAMNKNVKSGDNFVELLLEEGNDIALEWINDFFGDQCDDIANNSHYERCVFKDYYCALTLSRDAEAEYFDYEFFEDLLNEILTNYRKTSGAPNWWETNLEADELESWRHTPNNVCHHLKTT